MKEAIILAGGFGTRLRHVVPNLPKPMAPVAGRPFLEHLLDYIIPFGYSHVVLSTGFMAETIEAHFGSHYRGTRLSYAPETSPLGTGGGILNALQLCESQCATVFNGDTLYRMDLNLLANSHASHHSHLTIALRKLHNINRYDSILFNDQYQITGFQPRTQQSHEEPTTPVSTSIGCLIPEPMQPKGGWINGGIYQLDLDLFNGFRPGDAFSFERDILESRYSTQPFYVLPTHAYFIDIGVPDDYYRANIELERSKQ